MYPANLMQAHFNEYFANHYGPETSTILKNNNHTKIDKKKAFFSFTPMGLSTGIRVQPTLTLIIFQEIQGVPDVLIYVSIYFRI